MKIRTIALVLVSIILLVSLAGCGNNLEVNTEINNTNEGVEGNTSINENNVDKRIVGTAGSNIPLKDNQEEAETQIVLALQRMFKEEYGDDVVDSRITVSKVYTAEDEEEVEPIKEMNLGPNEVAFEVSYDLKPSKDADVDRLLIPNGEFDEETGWVLNIGRLGVLRENDNDGNKEYTITDFGTGW